MKFARLFVAVLLGFAAYHAASMDHYFYPTGPKPPGIPPDTASSIGVPLASWEDAAVDANAGAHAFGSDEWAHAECGFLARPDARILLKFGIAYAALDGQVESATLHLHVVGAVTTTPFLALGVARVTNGWAEHAVTWATRPAHGLETAGFSAVLPSDNTITVDVTTAIAAEQLANNADRHGICLADGAASSPYVATRESQTAACRPFLHLVTVPEPAVATVAVVGMALLRKQMRCLQPC